MLGVGTDIVEVARIASLYEKRAETFAHKILHTNEIAELQASSQPVAFLAKRFAAKEAVAKALGTGLAANVKASEIEVQHDRHGRPLVCLHGGTQQHFKNIGGQQCMLSLSDEKRYAVAFAVIQ